MKFYRAEEYQASCEQRYQKYKSEIEALLPDAVVEHVEHLPFLWRSLKATWISMLVWIAKI